LIGVPPALHEVDVCVIGVAVAKGVVVGVAVVVVEADAVGVVADPAVVVIVGAADAVVVDFGVDATVVVIGAGAAVEVVGAGAAVALVGADAAVLVVVGEGVGVVTGSFLPTLKRPRRVEVVPSADVITALMVCVPLASFAVSYGRALPSAVVPAKSKGAFLSVRTGRLFVPRGLSM
jgi:hypothetical protein